MYKKGRLCVFFIVCSLIVCLPGEAQRRRKANLNDELPIRIDITIDYQLGLTARGTIRGASPLLENTPYNEVGTEVFSKFVGNTSVASLGLPYRWNFTIVDNGSVNAYSLPDGEVSVGSGLARLIGTKPGLWSAVLSHETSPTARRNAVRNYLYRMYF